jgi:hypothetical protein
MHHGRRVNQDACRPSRSRRCASGIPSTPGRCLRGASPRPWGRPCFESWNRGGPLLASTGGSFLVSGEGLEPDLRSGRFAGGVRRPLRWLREPRRRLRRDREASGPFAGHGRARTIVTVLCLACVAARRTSQLRRRPFRRLREAWGGSAGCERALLQISLPSPSPCVRSPSRPCAEGGAWGRLSLQHRRGRAPGGPFAPPVGSTSLEGEAGARRR